MAKQNLHMLDYPVELAARRHALNLLDDAVAAAVRVDADRDDEALHDLRVAIRKLSSTLNAYEKCLGSKAQRIRRRLVELINQTNADRDRQVHVVWLSAQLAARTSRTVRTGVRIMLDEMESGIGASQAVDTTAILKRFHKQQRKLRSHLVDTAVAPITVQEPKTFGIATAAVIASDVASLRKKLADVRTVDDVEASHQARLAIKRLRYVVEPIAAEVAGGKLVVKKLKDAQDLLGELHDLQELEQQVVQVGRRAASDWSDSLFAAARGKGAAGDAAQLSACRALAALVKRISAEQRRIFSRFERQWLRGNSTFDKQTNALVRRLDPSRKQTTEKPQSSPQPSENDAD